MIVPRAAHVAAFHTAPATKVELDTLVGHASQRNHTLWRYFFPEPGNRSSIDVHANWLPHTSQCVHSSECWCGHVNGSKHRGTNPHPTECEAGLTGSKMSMVLRTANCVPSKYGLTCCKGGSWQGKCGPIGDPNFEHSWAEGLRVCAPPATATTSEATTLKATSSPPG